MFLKNCKVHKIHSIYGNKLIKKKEEEESPRNSTVENRVLIQISRAEKKSNRPFSAILGV